MQRLEVRVAAALDYPGVAVAAEWRLQVGLRPRAVAVASAAVGTPVAPLAAVPDSAGAEPRVRASLALRRAEAGMLPAGMLPAGWLWPALAARRRAAAEVAVLRALLELVP